MFGDQFVDYITIPSPGSLACSLWGLSAFAGCLLIVSSCAPACTGEFRGHDEVFQHIARFSLPILLPALRTISSLRLKFRRAGTKFAASYSTGTVNPPRFLSRTA